MDISDTKKERLKLAKVQLLMDNLPTVILATMAMATIMPVLLYNDMPMAFKLPWFLAFAVLTTIRMLHYRKYRKTGLNSKNVNAALLGFAIFTLIAGCLWGLMSFYMMSPDKPLNNIVIIMAFTGMIATATAATSYILYIFLCFSVPMVLATAYKFSILDDTQYTWLAVLILFYFSITLVTSRSVRQSIRQSIELRFENIDLIDNMTIENARTEEALEKANLASKAKSRFFAAASHDLRQPLHSLSLFTATLDTQIEDEDQKRVVSQIDSSVKSLEILFTALLDISALDAGTQKVHNQNLQLNQQLLQLKLETIQLAQEKQLQCHIDIGDHVVYTDPMLLDRVLRNLTANAIRYTDTGSVSISTKDIGTGIQIVVSDTGKGIDPVHQEKIFDEFVQLDNPERDRDSGLGLGLSIVKRICELLSYKLTLDSTLGKGSTFTIEVEKGDADKIPQHLLSDKNTDPDLDGLFVLVIDDEEAVRISMEGLLIAWGCTVMLASSGEEAVQQLIEFDQLPDIIISDFRLRNNETGGDAIYSVRQHAKSLIPGIIVTGDIAPERLLEIDALNLPVLHKPCDPAKLKLLLHDIS